ncbi:effector-binding domain-containing protein [Agromyces flavus]|uniref:Effector-binding domain-containing protein n=1 Tax=Agromyces flavus TaxID=589382 RepID=A0A1H1L5M9_9MICO|nr:GyrI-like domain-containing protein [Agromyces flavus]MCP2367442.1 effector-binding domain-containing protein [Agromyces flavus]GGI45722.1 hypothetical protein GCM10010932_10980 [Agromyces flavus]SDR69881.1 effector-binding domain-containing protein [Agromyces flavus]SDT41188.1 effector-binding domain-containing protein [Agromyces flavus]
MAYDVQVTLVPRKDAAVVRTRTTFDEIPEFMRSAFERVASVLGPRGLLGDGPAIGRYTEMDPASGSLSVAGFIITSPIEPEGEVVPDELPEGEVASTVHLGPYATISEAYDAIAAAMALHGREIDESTMWEEYWSPPGMPDEQVKTVVFCPLKPAG